MLNNLFSLYRFIRHLFMLPLTALGVSSSNCRFNPTCSQYCQQSIQSFGLINGSVLCLKRLSRCHPFY